MIAAGQSTSSKGIERVLPGDVIVEGMGPKIVKYDRVLRVEEQPHAVC
jgi:hypothetical protein